MEEKLVSILIPVYNRENFIKETFKSAIDQSYKNIEIIVVDNCSTDNSWDIIQDFKNNYPFVKIFRNEENIGPVRNWLKCVELASGYYSKILFSDDLMSSEFIEKAVTQFQEKDAFVISNFKILSGNETIFQSNLQKINGFTKKQFFDNVLLYNCFEYPFSPTIAVFRTFDLKDAIIPDIQNNLGLDFSKYGAGNDLLIFLITALKYENIKVIETFENTAKAHKDSITISNKLEIYYDFSKVYFVNTYLSNYRNKFKILQYFKNIRSTSEVSYKNVDGYLNFPFLLPFLIRKFFCMIK